MSADAFCTDPHCGEDRFPHLKHDRVVRGPDRRKAPRREVERHLHYALENLKAAALTTADCVGRDSDDPVLAALRAAADNYRRAEENAR